MLLTFLSVSISMIGCAGAALQVEGFSPPPPGAGAGAGAGACYLVSGSASGWRVQNMQRDRNGLLTH